MTGKRTGKASTGKRGKRGSYPVESRLPSSYMHPEADSPMRPEVGTQSSFRKKKAPRTYKYDSSLSPALEWDGQNPAREQGEALIRRILESKTLGDAQE